MTGLSAGGGSSSRTTPGPYPYSGRRDRNARNPDGLRCCGTAAQVCDFATSWRITKWRVVDTYRHPRYP